MILVLDIGTTALKGALFEEDGTLLETGQKRLSMSSSSSHSLHHEMDALDWIGGVREICAEFGLSSEKQPAAIVVSGNGPTLVPIGSDDKPLHRAILWMDRRSVEEAAIISEINGFYVDPTFYLPKALWFFKNKPEIYEKTKHFFSCPEYINYLLTGNAATILPMEKFRSYIWTEDLVSQLGMDWGKFPDFVRPGEPIGQTTTVAQDLLGVPPGVPVFAGGPDFIAAIIGTGTVAPGRACDRAGTSEGINLCTDQTVSDSRLLCVDHIIDGYSNVSGIVSTSGKAVQWFKEITGNREVPFAELFNDIEAVPAGSNKLIFLPYLAGERAPIWDPNARGAFIGLTMNHGRREMTRAVVESVGFAIRDIITVMEEIGLQVDELRITGGQARSAQWIQIKADITGKRFLLPASKDAELAGDLCIALFGLGHFDSLAEAAETAVQIERVFEPNKDNRRVYDDLFSVYRDSYAGLKGTFDRMSRMD
jgi:xylulokinase